MPHETSCHGSWSVLFLHAASPQASVGAESPLKPTLETSCRRDTIYPNRHEDRSPALPWTSNLFDLCSTASHASHATLALSSQLLLQRNLWPPVRGWPPASHLWPSQPVAQPGRRAPFKCSPLTTKSASCVKAWANVPRKGHSWAGIWKTRLWTDPLRCRLEAAPCLGPLVGRVQIL